MPMIDVAIKNQRHFDNKTIKYTLETVPVLILFAPTD
jgi:hypothetical protein